MLPPTYEELLCILCTLQEREVRRAALAREAGVLPPTYEELAWSNAGFAPEEPPAYSEIIKVSATTFHYAASVLKLVILQCYMSPNGMAQGRINYIDTKAKCSHRKN